MQQGWDQAAGVEAVQFGSAAQEEALKLQAWALVDCYLGQWTPEEPRPTAVETRVELPLIDPTTCEDLGIPLVGVIDLVTEGPTIIDFKTSRSSSPAPRNHARGPTHELRLSGANGDRPA